MCRDLSNNHLVSTIPDEIGLLTNLKLWCAPLRPRPAGRAAAGLAGVAALPPRGALLDALPYLTHPIYTHAPRQFYNNLLSGTLPESLGRLTSLTGLCAGGRTPLPAARSAAHAPPRSPAAPAPAAASSTTTS